MMFTIYAVIIAFMFFDEKFPNPRHLLIIDND